MYLEKLEIQGFKSFANKNTLVFPGLISGTKRGLTSIVGPNGSGKSNVADAVRWVLGEQSLKTLRGKKSEDVIFSGSDQKGQLSFAEVAITLNNEDKSALKRFEVEENNSSPEDVNNLDTVHEFLKADEIVIARRLYRSGESEYLINAKRVRLSDIQMLLAKANVGQKTYSIIGQGMVENFLNTSASERKDFFDEATGIKQFQIKRDLSINKLESSYENLQQVDMLLSEIRPRLKSLTRQVDKLHRRDEIEAELHQHQFNYYGYLYQEADQKLQAANQKYLDLEKTRFDQDSKLSALEASLENLRHNDDRQEINQLQAEINEWKNKKDQTWRELTRWQTELEHQLDAQGQYDISWLKTKNQELNQEAEKLQQELNSLKQTPVTEDLASGEAELAALDRQLIKTRQELKNLAELEREKDKNLQEIARLDTVLQVTKELLNNTGDEDVAEVAALDMAVKEAEQELNKTKEFVEGAKNKEQEAAQVVTQLNQTLAATSQELESLKNKLKKTELKSGKQVISAAVDKFLAELESLKDENDSSRLKERLMAAKNSFAAEIQEALDYGSETEMEQLKGLQEKMITLSQEKQQASDQLHETRLAEAGAQEAWRRAQVKYQEAQNKQNEYQNQRNKELKAHQEAVAARLKKDDLIKQADQLEQKIKAAQALDDSAELEAARQKINERLSAWRLELSTTQEKSRLLETRLDNLIREQKEIQDKIKKSEIKFDASDLEAKIETAQKERDDYQQKIKDLEEKLSALTAAKEAETAQMFTLQRQADEERRALSRLDGELNEWKVTAARLETKLENLESNIRDDELDLLTIKNHTVDTEVIDTERWRDRINSCKNQLELIGGIDPETEKEFDDTKERFDFLSGQTDDLNEAISSLEKIITELDGNIKERFDEEFTVISEKFSEYFKILFNGGNAKIFKVAEEELKDGEANDGTDESLSSRNLRKVKRLKKRNALGLSGVEIQATPPGKKIQTVAMLSGGERALTAIALICAIISANPSPFVVLDEVDAALDEANSERLARILDDLSNQTQFIVITHNRASMKRANVLYGITMKADGVSQLLSIKLEKNAPTEY